MSRLELIDCANAAKDLIAFLRANVGDNDDWPVEIITDSPETSQELAAKLTALEQSISDWL